MNDLDQPSTVQEINRLHGELQGLATQSVDRAIRIGELLSEAKTQVPHGRWIPWLRSNATFSERTARNYVSVFENRTILKSARVADLTEAYKMLGDRSQKRVASMTGNEESFWARQEELAPISQLPPMTREEAEQADAKLVSLIRGAREQAPKIFAEVRAFLKSAACFPEYVQSVRQAWEDFEDVFGPFDLPKLPTQPDA